MAATCKVSLSLTGYTSSLAAGTYNMGEEKTITLTCSKYYAVNESALPYLRFTRYGESIGEETFTKVSDTECRLVTTLNPFSEIPSDGYSCNASIKGIGNLVNFEIVNCLTDCVSDCADGCYLSGTRTITVSCASNFEFEVTPYMEYKKTTTQTTTVDFEKVSDTQYKITFDFVSGKTYTFYGEAVKQTPIADKYGFVRAYRLTREQVLEVSNKRWVEVTWDAEKYKGVNVLYVPNEEYIDTARFVTAFFKLFVPLETELKHNLTFGPYSMEMECDVISDDIITLDCGTVDIIGRYQNSIDYKHTTLEIYLPFIGFTPLSVSDFMDKSVNLTYQINTMNGDALAILKANGHPVFSHSCNVAMKIPFQLGINEYVSTELEPNNNYLLNTPPFITVSVNPATDPDTVAPYRNTKFYARFGTLTGYTEATEIDMVILPEHTFITKTEIDEIVSLLESGVFL